MTRGQSWPSDIQARRRWGQAQDLATDWPAPEVVATLAVPVGVKVPRACTALATLARGRDWKVEITYARGTAMGRHGRSLGVVDSLAVRMWHPDGRRAVGVWHDGKPTEQWLWRGGDLPVVLATSARTELTSTGKMRRESFVRTWERWIVSGL